MIWLVVYLPSVAVSLIASGALDGIGWVFYHLTMDLAAHQRERQELATAMMHYESAQLAMIASLHQHAHTMASLTGQPGSDPRHNPWVFPPT